MQFYRHRNPPAGLYLRELVVNDHPESPLSVVVLKGTLVECTCIPGHGLRIVVPSLVFMSQC